MLPLLTEIGEKTPIFRDYQEVLAWIERKGKEYGGKKRFQASEEFKRAYPQINRLYQESLKSHQEKKRTVVDQKTKDISAAGLKIGDRVELFQVGMFMMQVHLTGVLILRGGAPTVKVDPSPFTPKTFVPWNKSWERMGSR